MLGHRFSTDGRYREIFSLLQEHRAEEIPSRVALRWKLPNGSYFQMAKTPSQYHGDRLLKKLKIRLGIVDPPTLSDVPNNTLPKRRKPRRKTPLIDHVVLTATEKSALAPEYHEKLIVALAQIAPERPVPVTPVRKNRKDQDPDHRHGSVRTLPPEVLVEVNRIALLVGEAESKQYLMEQLAALRAQGDGYAPAWYKPAPEAPKPTLREEKRKVDRVQMKEFITDLSKKIAREEGLIKEGEFAAQRRSNLIKQKESAELLLNEMESGDKMAPAGTLRIEHGNKNGKGQGRMPGESQLTTRGTKFNGRMVAQTVARFLSEQPDRRAKNTQITEGIRDRFPMTTGAVSATLLKNGAAFGVVMAIKGGPGVSPTWELTAAGLAQIQKPPTSAPASMQQQQQQQQQAAVA